MDNSWEKEKEHEEEVKLKRKLEDKEDEQAIEGTFRRIEQDDIDLESPEAQFERMADDSGPSSSSNSPPNEDIDMHALFSLTGDLELSQEIFDWCNSVNSLKVGRNWDVIKCMMF